LEDAEADLLMLDEEDRIPYPLWPCSSYRLNFLILHFGMKNCSWKRQYHFYRAAWNADAV